RRLALRHQLEADELAREARAAGKAVTSPLEWALDWLRARLVDGARAGAAEAVVSRRHPRDRILGLGSAAPVLSYFPLLKAPGRYRFAIAKGGEATPHSHQQSAVAAQQDLAADESTAAVLVIVVDEAPHRHRMGTRWTGTLVGWRHRGTVSHGCSRLDDP